MPACRTRPWFMVDKLAIGLVAMPRAIGATALLALVAGLLAGAGCGGTGGSGTSGTTVARRPPPLSPPSTRPTEVASRLGDELANNNPDPALAQWGVADTTCLPPKGSGSYRCSANFIGSGSMSGQDAPHDVRYVVAVSTDGVISIQRDGGSGPSAAQVRTQFVASCVQRGFSGGACTCTYDGIIDLPHATRQIDDARAGRISHALRSVYKRCGVDPA